MESGGEFLEQAESYEGYCSIEEHVQDCIEFFLIMQQCETGQPEETQKPEESQKPEEGFLERLAENILEREKVSTVFLPAPYLRESCKLTQTEYWLVMFAFCCELEGGVCLQFWKKYNDMRPTIQYALHLLSQTFTVNFALIAGLCGYGQPIGDILELSAESEKGRGILQQPLLLRRRAFYFLLTGNFRQKELPWAEGLQETAQWNSLGKVIVSRYSLEDLVVSKECRRQLETVIRLSEIWFHNAGDWREEREGLQILFHGTSGTGKTMAASVLAARLQRPLFKVDISRIFDKYIGETEKHLDDIFQRAQRGSYILFFDEADALFSKRTSIQDSHDKYANVSTAYLLQRIETFDGILILATNLIDSFDDAFLRRVRFVIKFKNLEEEDRELLWKRLLKGADLAEDVSCRALARAAELSPARIRVVVQTARMLAVSEGSRQLTSRHFRIALELETGKDETALNYE